MMNRLPPVALAGLLAIALLGSAPAQAQEAAVIKRATELRDAPSESGRSLAPLPASTTVTRTAERKGAWTRVSTAQGASGWVHMFDLAPQSGAATASNSGATGGLRSVGGLFGANSGSTTTATSTIGIRGLGAEDIANAQPNPGAVGQAEGMRVNADQARQFAQNAALQPRSVPALAAPARAPSPSGGGTGSSNNPADPNFSPN